MFIESSGLYVVDDVEQFEDDDEDEAELDADADEQEDEDNGEIDRVLVDERPGVLLLVLFKDSSPSDFD